ncbi:MAG: hypothetical protein HY854_06900 [Burkholderiales bacterium]|nr:hypothetical protein [Burkholderiales bacterium]
MKLNIVPARTGILWVKLGIQTFLKQPLALAGLLFMYIAVVLVLSAIPVIGRLLAGLLVPAATLGLMAATAEAAEGRFPMPTVLVSGFRVGRQRARAMLVLGVIYVAGSVVAALVGSMFGTGPLVAPPAGSAPGTPQLDTATFATLLLHLPLIVCFWHAPALVHWHGISPVKSLFFSAVACMRNFWAFTVYSLVWTAVLMFAATILGTLGALLGGEALMQAVLMPTVVLVMAMTVTSMYFTFRDSFIATPENPQPTGGDPP